MLSIAFHELWETPFNPLVGQDADIHWLPRAYKSSFVAHRSAGDGGSLFACPVCIDASR